MVTLPFLEVSHLPASSSFFSAVLQPLGLHYIHDPAANNSVAFGADASIVFRLRQAENIVSIDSTAVAPKLSTITISAPTGAAVTDFYAVGLRSHPALLQPGRNDGGATLDVDTGGDFCRATLHDLDGNMIETIYSGPRSSTYGNNASAGQVRYSGAPVHRTQSTRTEAGRILRWNFDVASSSPQQPPAPVTPSPAATAAAASVSRAPAAGPRSTHQDGSHPYTLRRSHTDGAPSQSATLSQQSAVSRDADPKASSSSASAATAAVALLGAAAGAAVTYGLVQREKSRVPRFEADPSPYLPRRSTFPEVYDQDTRSHYGTEHWKDSGNGPASRKLEYRIAPPSSVKSGRRPDYGSLDNPWSKSPPRGLLQRTHSGGASSFKALPSGVSRDDAYDGRSRHSARYSSHTPTATVRTRSEGPRERASVAPVDTEPRGRAPSRPDSVSRPPLSRAHRLSARDLEGDSYYSAKSRRSMSNGPPPPAVERDVVMRSRAGSKASTIRMATPRSELAREGDLPRRAPSHTSARNVPLPPSGVGSSRANWDDDMASVAPSDSISCVGSKSSRHSRRRYN